MGFESFNTTNKKIEKTENKQNAIDNTLSKKQNALQNLKSSKTIIRSEIPLFDSEFQVFSTVRPFGGLTSISIDMPIVADDIIFTGQLNITEEMIPHVRHNIICEKLIGGNIRGVFVANISTYDNNPSTQTNIFQEDTPIFNTQGQLVGNTGSGTGTSPDGDNFVIVTSNSLFTVDGQRNIFSNDSTFSLEWEKVTENVFNFSIQQRVMFVIPSEDNVGITNQEGDQEYNATIVDEEIIHYTVTDKRISVPYDAYRPITSDINARLLLSIPSRNLWEDYFNTKL